MVRIRLRQDRFADLANRQGWTKANGTINASRVAGSIDMSVSTVTRHLLGEYPITYGFIGRVLAAATDLTFADLFEVEDADDEAERAAS